MSPRKGGRSSVGASSADSPKAEIIPDHYWQDGAVPVFKPTWEQFRSFPDFIAKIDHYGMKAGIVKVIPPQEWLDLLPDLDDKVKEIRVRSAIEQNFAGSGGAFKQMNIEKQRSYNLVQWRKICDSSEHQPPAKRGEVRQMGGARTKAELEGEDTPPRRREKRPTTGTSASAGDKPDEFDGFDYRIHDNDKYTVERCQELEKSYWKSLTYNQPMYGADLPGSLFDDSVKEWNVAHLDNILNRLGKVLPGVNSAYLYLGMWKASFSWHVEDMDLYSINYIHFGAPKQWYSISQEHNSKFEKVMRDIFPTDARHCSQFMRHKTFGASPAKLAQHGVEVNRLVHYEKEFVITFPYGYHSGYNLGYNCAESVNFATEEWLEFGKVAEKCECINDAVSIDVNDIIKQVHPDRTSNDLPTPPASEDGEATVVATVAATKTKSRKLAGRALKRSSETIDGYKKIGEVYHEPVALKRIKLAVSPPRAKECLLCPHTRPYERVLRLSDGSNRTVHHACAQYIPETRMVDVPDAKETHVGGFDDIPKARFGLRCAHCKEVAGACFQCSAPRCCRAWHGSCAMAAGVLIECNEEEGGGEGEDGAAYTFACKAHRPKRPPGHTLEFDQTITDFCSGLLPGMHIQLQMDNGHTFAARVRENRKSERLLLVERNDLDVKLEEAMEVDYRWVLPGSYTGPGEHVPQPADTSVVKVKKPRAPRKPKVIKVEEARQKHATETASAAQFSARDNHPVSPASLGRSPPKTHPGTMPLQLHTTAGQPVYAYSAPPYYHVPRPASMPLPYNDAASGMWPYRPAATGHTPQPWGHAPYAYAYGPPVGAPAYAAGPHAYRPLAPASQQPSYRPVSS